MNIYVVSIEKGSYEDVYFSTIEKAFKKMLAVIEGEFGDMPAPEFQKEMLDSLKKRGCVRLGFVTIHKEIVY